MPSKEDVRGGYWIQNPSAGNDYYDASGTAITSANQPKKNSGAGTHLGAVATGSQLLINNTPGYRNRAGVFGSRVVASWRQGVISAFLATGVAASSVATNGGFCKFTKNTHGLVVGDVVVVYGATAHSLNTVHTVTAKDANTFTTDVVYEASATAGTYQKKDTSYTFATMTAGRYVMRRGGANTEWLAGVASTTLRSAGSEYGIRRSIHRRESVRTVQTATAIRAGYWNIYSGTWSTRPTEQDDITTWDDEYGTGSSAGVHDDTTLGTSAKPGELVYRESKPLPKQDDYKAKYLW